MYEESPKLCRATCTRCNSSYPCECGHNEGTPNIDDSDADAGVRFAMSEEQARRFNAASFWKRGSALLKRADGTYELYVESI